MTSISKKITILDIVAILTIPLLAVIGYMNNEKQKTFIAGQDAMNIELKEIRKEMRATSIKSENHEGRISRAEDDVKEIRDTQGNYGKRINKLEGSK
jgi:hypothetical protein